jgi:PAS domain S-box-containing protein
MATLESKFMSHSRSPWNWFSRLRYLVRGLVLCAIVFLFFTIELHAGEAEQVKRVLIVHSFGSTAPPFTTHSTAFESALKRQMGKWVDLDEVSLDMARYAQPDMEETFVEFLLKRLAKWSPDLVVPIGSPAGRFVAKYRTRLFPQIPVIYTGMDRRTLPAGPLQNATFVGESFNLAGLVEDILQLAPDATNIAVVIGATPLERYWATEFRRAFEPFANRVNFIWFNDLSFDQMLERAAQLPPRSFILIGLFLRDALGVTYNQEEALQRLHAVANAPINGLFQHQLGLGIVGGRLYQAEVQGIESARIAVRVLRGEPVSNFPPLIIPAQGPQYDWRELQRWNIPEDRLPIGSVIAFRQPTVWQQHRWYLIGALVVIFIQAAMIFDLLLQRGWRRRAEEALEKEKSFLRQVIDTDPNFIFAKDREGHFTLANKAVADAYGTTVDNLIGKSDADFNPNRDEVESFRQMDLEVIDTLQERFIPEERITNGKGRVRWLQTVKRPIIERDGSSKQVLGASTDITQRKQTEMELREQRAELAHVARISTMGELAASLAHELNQPLTAILSNAQAALRFLSARPADIGEVREILQDIVKDNSRAGEVIRRMRSLVKKEQLDFALVDMASLVREVAALVHSDAILLNVNLAVKTAHGLPTVQGDKVQLQQVVLNLLLNAFDAMKEYPPKERQVKLSVELNDAGLIQMAVSDRGPGLSGDKLDKIFQPFYTTKGEGLGMGLSICRSIIEAHRGRLWAENNADCGATFYFTLPLEGAQTKEKCRMME